MGSCHGSQPSQVSLVPRLMVDTRPPPSADRHHWRPQLRYPFQHNTDLQTQKVWGTFQNTTDLDLCSKAPRTGYGNRSQIRGTNVSHHCFHGPAGTPAGAPPPTSRDRVHWGLRERTTPQHHVTTKPLYPPPCACTHTGPHTCTYTNTHTYTHTRVQACTSPIHRPTCA